MKYSKTAIRELSAKYRNVLMKCFFLNAALLVSVGTARAAVPADPTVEFVVDTNETFDTLTFKDGGYLQNAGAQVKVGTMTSTIDGFSTSSVYGSGRQKENSQLQVNDASVTLKDATISRFFLGASNFGSGASAVINNTTATISGATNITTKIQLGGYSKKRTSSVIKNATLNIMGGSIEGPIYGNSYVAGAIDTEADETAEVLAKSVVENANIVISGGKLKAKEIYSGGEISESSFGVGAKTETKNFNVTFKGNAGTAEAGEYASLENGYDGLKIYTRYDVEQKGIRKTREQEGVVSSLIFDNYNGAFKAETIGHWDKVSLKNSVVGTNVVLGEGATYEFTVNDKTKLDGTVTLNGQVNLHPIVLADTTTGDYEFAKDVNVSDGSWKLMADNNKLYTLALNENNKSVSFEKKSQAEITEDLGLDGAQSGIVEGILAGGASDNVVFNENVNALSAALQSSDPATVQQAKNAMTAMATEAAPMTQSTETGVVGQVFGVVSSRMSGGSVTASAKAAPSSMPAKAAPAGKGGKKGASSGDMMSGLSTWAQGLYNRTRMGDTKESQGFKSYTKGVAFGLEGMMNEKVKLGVAYAYNQSDVKGFLRKTDVKAHTAMLYGEYKVADWYTNMIASYGWSNYKEKKSAMTLIRADYDVDRWGIQAMTGYQFNVNGVGIVPEAGVRYLHLDQEAYKDSMGQRISQNTSDLVTGIFGTNVSKTWQMNKHTAVTPEIRAGVSYDFKTDEGGATIILPNGAAYQVQGEALDKWAGEIGVGVTAEINDNVEVSLSYAGTFRENYRDHSGILNVKYHF